MLWTWLPSSWAPNLTVTIQSQPAYFIETAFYCTVALIVCIALLSVTVGPQTPARVVLRVASHASPISETTREVQAEEADVVAADFPAAVIGRKANRGDGDTVPLTLDGGVQDDDHDGDAYKQTLPFRPVLEPSEEPTLTCAACRGRDLDWMREAATDSEDTLMVEVDNDSVSSLESEDGNWSTTTTMPLAVVEAVGEAMADKHDMVKYVMARYRGFKQATQAGQLLVVDSRPTAMSVLPEADPVTVWSRALRRTRVEAGPKPAGPPELPEQEGEEM